LALKRIIPCLLFNGNGLVKTIKFKNPAYVGDPVNAIKIFNEKEVDELVVLDINASREKRKPAFDKIADMAGEAFMPFAYGGGVKTFDDFAQLYKLGVEKVIVNSLIRENPGVIKEVVTKYGSQAVVASVDFKKKLLGTNQPYSYLGDKMSYSLSSYITYLSTELGVGELLLTSVDRDGTWKGYNTEVTREVVNSISIPVIASGGCGKVEDIVKVLYECNANAAAVGSMAVYSKQGMGVLINFPGREKIIKE
jgi:imidazole glycerol-phosphate synthase subunit HisF